MLQGRLLGARRIDGRRWRAGRRGSTAWCKHLARHVAFMSVDEVLALAAGPGRLAQRRHQLVADGALLVACRKAREPLLTREVSQVGNTLLLQLGSRFAQTVSLRGNHCKFVTVPTLELFEALLVFALGACGLALTTLCQEVLVVVVLPLPFLVRSQLERRAKARSRLTH